MFRTAELGSRIEQAEYEERVPTLRRELLELQTALRKFDRFPVILLFAGVDGAGKSQTINLLNEWMDPRWLLTRAYGPPSDEEQERPRYWRYWRDLPPRGRIGLFLSSWYSRPILEHVYGESDEQRLRERLDRVTTFENALADEGALVLKFWMHLSREAQEQRLKALEADPLTRYRVSERDWKHWELYDRFVSTAEHVITNTSSGKTHWHIVEGADANYRSLTVGTLLRDAMREHLEHQRVMHEVRARRQKKADSAGEKSESATQTLNGAVNVLDKLDMSQRLKKKDYRTQLMTYQAQLNLLSRKARENKRSTILVFEGPDAAGKGGAVRRITAALDARHFQVIPVAAPTDEERAHHYLWRFWRHLSRAGRLTVFDRSWYGRVLVERVEGFASVEEWKRAYREINDFESQLIDHGTLLVKYWLHISEDEQLARFQEREATPHKRWKLTEEDWRNRESWHAYQNAVQDMVQHTSTSQAPWTLVEGNDKRFARIKVLRTLCERLEEMLS